MPLAGKYLRCSSLPLQKITWILPQTIKQSLKAAGSCGYLESSVDWKDFKLNSDGLIPVIVQDYKSNEVLMLAYMNEEAFDNTLATGRMTYFSRSRQAQWVKERPADISVCKILKD